MLALLGTSLPVAQVAPASTGRMAPVIHLASSPAKNLTTAPMSHPVPSVFSTLRFFLAALASSLMPPENIMGV